MRRNDLVPENRRDGSITTLRKRSCICPCERQMSLIFVVLLFVVLLARKVGDILLCENVCVSVALYVILCIISSVIFIP
jgi:hypothetical protein